jgi:RNA polymerase sigma-70 factor (ECF subfamily)
VILNVSELWKEHAEYVLKICSRYLKSAQAAEDVRQEVFLKIINSKKNFKEESSIRTWLYAITFRCCVDYFRTMKKQHEIMDNYRRMENVCLNDSQSPIWEVNDISVMPCPISQLFVELYYGDGLSREEIAQIFGVSVTHVHKRIQIGIHQLRKFV